MKKIITGITVEEQMKRARVILDKIVKMQSEVKICKLGHIMREVKTSIGSYWICDQCGEMKN